MIHSKSLLGNTIVQVHGEVSVFSAISGRVVESICVLNFCSKLSNWFGNRFVSWLDNNHHQQSNVGDMVYCLP